MSEIQTAFEALVEAVAFYADPESYHAIFIMPDRPAGEFADDFSEDHGNNFYNRPMPGAKARAALKLGPTLLKALAEVWDDAYRAGIDDANDHALGLASGRLNPYREEYDD